MIVIIVIVVMIILVFITITCKCSNVEVGRRQQHPAHHGPEDGLAII